MSAEICWYEGVPEGNLGQGRKRIGKIRDEFFLGDQIRRLSLSETFGWDHHP
ncbi:MAG: hypothetical protein WCA59_18475 [Candidatus Binataceae bacterium]